MRFLTEFVPPEELEMLERGFGLSPEHDPNEAVVSFFRDYGLEGELKITFTMGAPSSVSVAVTKNGGPIASLTIEGVKGVAFQAWHGESIMRFSFTAPGSQCDLRIHYEPKPSIHYSSLATGA